MLPLVQIFARLCGGFEDGGVNRLVEIEIFDLRLGSEILDVYNDICDCPVALDIQDRSCRNNFQRQVRKICCKSVNDLLPDLFCDIEMSSANCDFQSYTSFFECCLNINPAFRISSSNTRKSEFFQKEGSGSGKSSLQRCAFPISFRIFPVRHKKTPGAI